MTGRNSRRGRWLLGLLAGAAIGTVLLVGVLANSTSGSSSDAPAVGLGLDSVSNQGTRLTYELQGTERILTALNERVAGTY